MNEKWIYEIADRFEKINQYTIQTICKHIKEIGRILPSDIDKIKQLNKMHHNLADITKRIAHETKYSVQEINKMFDELSNSFYTSDIIKYIEPTDSFAIMANNYFILNYVESVKRLTQNSMINLANSTQISVVYRKALDIAIDTVALGVDDYQKTMRRTIETVGQTVTRVEYASGHKRRLDTAVRMNLFDGVRDIYNGISKINGEQFGADAVLISAHADCALDHLDIQGKVYSIAEFDKLNSTLHRPISTMNCRHFISYTKLGRDNPYSQEYLDRLREASLKLYDVNGKKVTSYKASQMMREAETRMRYTLDAIEAFESVGDRIGLARKQDLLANQKLSYLTLCRKTENRPQWNRIFV